MSVEEAALGALQVQKYGMTQAIELNSVRRGYDPREFTLVAAGGGGPMFACDIALELEIARVLVPPHPGIIAATGLLATDLQHEFVATERHPLKTPRPDAAPGPLRRARPAGGRPARGGRRARGSPPRPPARRLPLRRPGLRGPHRGARGGRSTDGWVEELKERFHAAHEAEYGHRFDAPIEIINIRAVAIGRVDELAAVTSSRPATATRRGRRRSSGTSSSTSTARPSATRRRSTSAELLRAGDRIEGPAIVEQYDTTTVIPPGLEAEIDRHGNIVIDCTTRQRAETARGAALATPILMRVIGGAFAAIAKEMAGVLYRMSYSSIIRESEDLGAGIFDRDGNELAESDSTPMFMGAMPKIVKNVIAILGDDIHDGDVILHNDPYGGATHSPDVAIVIPIFFDGELVGFSGASAHVLDIGGAYPGLAIDLVDNWSEGNIYRAVKLQEQGVWQAGLWKHILENVRTPSFNNGRHPGDDRRLRAGEAPLRRAARPLRRGDRARRRARLARVLRAHAPPGDREGARRALRDRRRLARRRRRQPRQAAAVKIAVEIAGDEITYDLTGSSDEVPTGYNCPFEGTTVSAMTFITRMIFLDEATYPVFVPQNEGMLAPVNVVAPKGSIFNPNYPRACFARFCQVQRAVDLALRALAPVLPDQITAGNSAHLHFISYSGFIEEEGEYWVYLEVDEGSYGGRPGRDGLDSVDCLIANTRNNPIEELEWRFPMRTERYELRDDPCAAGKWRGGIGMVRVNRFLEDTIVTCEGDRVRRRPAVGHLRRPRRHPRLRQGHAPGRHRGVLALEVHRARRCRPAPRSRSACRTPAATATRSSATRRMVLSDVLDGFTTVELAERDYGVMIDAETMTLAADATAELREERGSVKA